jgi:beta-glucosidase
MINVNEILQNLTLEEKVCLLSGHKSWHTNKVSRVGLPSIFLTDGPHGLRKKKADDKIAGLGQTELSTCFPAACTTGSSWNKELLYKMEAKVGDKLEVVHCTKNKLTFKRHQPKEN